MMYDKEKTFESIKEYKPKCDCRLKNAWCECVKEETE